MIELDSRYDTAGEADSSYEELLLSLPTPLLEELRRVEAEPVAGQRLAGLCFAVIPMTFQYVALILSGEYLASKRESNHDVIDSLWNMVQKPGPGKWVDFIRHSLRYFEGVDPQVLPRKTIEELKVLLLAEKLPQVKVYDEDPKGKRLDYVDALVNLRNRGTHHFRLTRDKAAEIYADYIQIYRAFLFMARHAFEAVPLIRDIDGKRYLSIDSRHYSTIPLRPEEINASMVLWNPSTEAHIQLFPLLLPMPEKGIGEAAFLEEVKGRSFLYQYRDELIRKTGEEFSRLIGLIETRTPETHPLTSEDLTIALLGERIDRLTKRALSGFQDSLKYIPEIYLERKEIEGLLDTWVESAADQPGCILLGDPGSGKTSLVSHWCENRRDIANDHVILLEASKLEKSDIFRIIEEHLKFSSELTLSDCLETVKRKIKGEGGKAASKRFIIVVEAINEYVGNDINSRPHLWRKVNSLIEMLGSYRPYFKCLITTRSDLWKDDFPNRKILAEKLTQSMYYGEVDPKLFFPCIRVGFLNDIEAERIYEDARAKKPGMSPLTTYSDLPRKTKTLVRNPFQLRLVLQAFHGEAAPALTSDRLQRHFAKTTALEEQEKVTLLFRLLERIAYLRKTEITLEELFAEKAKEKGDKERGLFGTLPLKTKRKRPKQEHTRPLEEIIYDIKPQGPYKKLLADGIIEERVSGQGENTKVLLSFPHEKINDIMYDEFLRRSFRRTIRNQIILLLSAVIIASLFYFGIGSYFPHKFESQGGMFLSGSSLNLNQSEKDDLLRMVAAIYSRAVKLSAGGFAIMILSLSVFLTLYNISNNRFRFFLARRIPMNLPIRFLKERLNEEGRKYIKYFIAIPLFMSFVYLIFMLVIMLKENPSVDAAIHIIVNFTRFMIFFVIISNLFQNLFVVIRKAPYPEAAYVRFGIKEAILDFFAMLHMIISLLIGIFLIIYLLVFLDLRHDTRLIELRQQYITSSVHAKMLLSDTDNAKKIDNFFSKYDSDSGAVARPFLLMFFKGISLPLLFAILLFLLLEILIARPLEHFLRRRQSHTHILSLPEAKP